MWTINELIDILEFIKKDNQGYDIEIHNMNFSINDDTDIVTIEYVCIDKKGCVFDKKTTFKNDWVEGRYYKI